MRLKYAKLITNLANTVQAMCGDGAAGDLVRRLRDEAAQVLRGRRNRLRPGARSSWPAHKAMTLKTIARLRHARRRIHLAEHARAAAPRDRLPERRNRPPRRSSRRRQPRSTALSSSPPPRCRARPRAPATTRRTSSWPAPKCRPKGPRPLPSRRASAGLPAPSPRRRRRADLPERLAVGLRGLLEARDVRHEVRVRTTFASDPPACCQRLLDVADSLLRLRVQSPSPMNWPSSPQATVPATNTWFPTRTARENPNTGSNGEPEEMFCRSAIFFHLVRDVGVS